MRIRPLRRWPIWIVALLLVSAPLWLALNRGGVETAPEEPLAETGPASAPTLAALADVDGQRFLILVGGERDGTPPALPWAAAVSTDEWPEGPFDAPVALGARD